MTFSLFSFGARKMRWCYYGNVIHVSGSPRPVCIDIYITAESWRAMKENNFRKVKDIADNVARMLNISFYFVRYRIVRKPNKSEMARGETSVKVFSLCYFS